MIFIFEDNEYDDLSKLYRHCYGKHSIHKFIYAKGNGNLVKCAEI